MLLNILAVLVWFALLTFWILISNERKEQKMIAEFEADVFGEKQ